ncbi:MAG: hypothetical protein ABR497_08450 [Kiritimatiellia bacterium]|nr:hypothetical protein [Lentisphaerota bacterium]
MQVTYARFNRHRLPRFQLATMIMRDSTRLLVRKTALTDAAIGHLRGMQSAHDLLEAQRASTDIALPRILQATGAMIDFEFLPFASVDQLLFEAFHERQAAAFRDILDDYANIIATAFGSAAHPQIGDELREIFGADIKQRLDAVDCGPCAPVAFLDPVFENVLVDGRRRIFIDNEWVLPGALPVNFMVFRALYYFYRVKYSDFNIDACVSLDEMLERYRISAGQSELFQAMDDDFQAHVFGRERCYRYRERYLKFGHPTVDSMEKTIAHQREVVIDLHRQLSALQNTPEWRLISMARNLIAPVGSRRRRLIQKIVLQRGTPRHPPE